MAMGMAKGFKSAKAVTRIIEKKMANLRNERDNVTVFMVYKFELNYNKKRILL